MKNKTIVHNLIGNLGNFTFLVVTNIVMVPYYFKYVSTVEYGIWLGGISFLSLVSVLESNITLILTQQLGVLKADKKTDEFSRYYFAALIFGLFVLVLICAGTYLIKADLSKWVNPGGIDNAEISNAFQLYSISLGLVILSGFISTITQVFFKTLLPPFFNLISAIVGIGVTVIEVPLQGIVAIASGNLIKALVYMLLISVYAIAILREERLAFKIDINYIDRLVRSIGLPFISKIAITLALNSQNFIVAATISPAATTIFEITKKLPMMAVMIVNMIGVSTFTAFSAFYAEQKGNKDSHEYTKFYFSIIRVLLFGALAGIYLLGQDFVTFWVGTDKFGGNLLLGLFCLTVLTDQLRLTLSQQYYAVGKFNLTAITDTFFSICFLLFALILIPLFKLYGIVYAGILANALYFISCIYLEKRFNIQMSRHIVNWRTTNELLIIVVGISTLKFIYELYRGNLIIDVGVVLAAIVTLCIFLYLRQNDLVRFLMYKLKLIKT